MKIVAVQYKNGDGFGSKEYNYYTESNFNVGDIIQVPVGVRTSTAKVSRINVDESEISDAIKPYMKVIH